MNYFLCYLCILTILFVIYIELNVGGIFYRVNSSGKQSFHLSGLLHYLTHPLHNSFLWNRNLLDVNYIFILLLSSMIYFTLKLIFI